MRLGEPRMRFRAAYTARRCRARSCPAAQPVDCRSAAAADRGPAKAPGRGPPPAKVGPELPQAARESRIEAASVAVPTARVQAAGPLPAQSQTAIRRWTGRGICQHLQARLLYSEGA